MMWKGHLNTEHTMISAQQARDRYVSLTANINIGDLELSDVVVHILVLIFVVHLHFDYSESRN